MSNTRNQTDARGIVLRENQTIIYPVRNRAHVTMKFAKITNVDLCTTGCNLCKVMVKKLDTGREVKLTSFHNIVVVK